jgi:chemotaxis protein histidine kinase CheA
MQLNEIIEENTLSAISRKTRLSIENLEKLFDHNFHGLRKVQALGFIAILEREYRADLSDLRDQCQAFFLEKDASNDPGHLLEPHASSSRRRPVIVESSTGRKGISFAKPFVVALIVAGVLYAAWQTYSDGMEPEDANSSRPNQESGFFVSIINQAKTWMGSQEASTEEEDVVFDTNETAVAEEQNTDENAFVIAEKPSQDQTNEAPKTTQNTDDVVQKVQEEETQKREQERPQTAEEQLLKLDDALATAAEENSSKSDVLATEVPSITSDAQKGTEEQNVIKEAAREEASTDTEADKPAEEASADTEAEKPADNPETEASNEISAQDEAARTQAEKEAALKKAAEESAVQEEAAQIKEAKAKIVVLKPRTKTWLGIVNLTNMKRRVATTKTPQTFDTAQGRWIVATGHGRIDFMIGETSKKFNDGKQHFLLIEKGSVKEIPHKRFQKMNKSKVW